MSSIELVRGMGGQGITLCYMTFIVLTPLGLLQCDPVALAVGLAKLSDLVTQQPQHVLAAGRNAVLGSGRGGDGDGAGGGVDGVGLRARA